MLVNSALLKNDLNQAKKYLQILENLQRAGYVYKRVKVLIALKENDIKNAESYLLKYSSDYKEMNGFQKN